VHTRTLAFCLLVLLALTAGTAGTAAARVDDLTLATQFRPQLLFDSADPWRPLDVDAFLAEPGHKACRAARKCEPLTSVSQLTNSITKLDLRGTRNSGRDARNPEAGTCAKSHPDLRDCDLGGRSVIYAHVVPGGQRVAIDYWWFMRFNRNPVDFHEGDWEGATVIVNSAGTRVEEVHFPAHADVWRYGDRVPLFDGRHVRVYLAHNTHAAYPHRCRALCRQTRHARPEGHANGKRQWVGNRDADCIQCVRLFPAGTWNAWNGLWGKRTTHLLSSPRTPGFQGRFQDPFKSRFSKRYR
jgi:hypothetical protein